MNIVKKYRKLILIDIFFIACVIYSVYFFPELMFHQEPYAYFNYLLDAMFHGRLNIFPPSVTQDLSLYHGKFYLNWGPGPLLFILPFYLLGGVHVSDTVYNAICGVGNIVIFYFILVQFIQYFQLKNSFSQKIFLLLNFAFCSPNLFLGVIGRVWNTEQIVATLYLLICYLCYFLFLNKNKLAFLLLSVLFFNLACISRYTMIFSGILFIYPFYQLWKQKTNFLKAIVLAASISIFFIIVIFLYNYVRFGVPLETGLKYHLADKRYMLIVAERQFFSASYISHNIYYFFLNPIHFMTKKPFIQVDREGNSIFFVYPLLIFLFLLVRKRYWQSKRRSFFIFLSLSTILITTMLLLCYFATGYVQFGSRYFQDIIPIGFLLTLFILPDIPLPVQMIWITYGSLINIIGVVSIYHR